MTLYLAVNSRLSQFLESYLLSKQLKDSAVVVTPNIATWNVFCDQWQQQQLMAGLIDYEALPAKILSDFEALLIWESLLKKADINALLNPAETAKHLFQAWQYSEEYFDESAFEDTFKNEEIALFLSLKSEYKATLTALNYWDSTLLSQKRLQWFAQAPAVCQQIKLVGFDETTPYLKTWLAQQKAKGADVQFLAQTDFALPSAETCVPCLPKLLAAKSLQEEAQQAALWAYQQVSEQGLESVAIVAPRVEAVHEALTWALDELMWRKQQYTLPSQQAHWQDSPLYNVSLGEPLSNCPLIQQVFQALKICGSSQKPVSFDFFSNWLIAGTTPGDFLARQTLDFQLRRWQWASIRLPKLLAKIEEKELIQKQCFKVSPYFLTRLNSAMETIENLSSRLSIHAFEQAFQTLLTQLGWQEADDSRPLDSQEFQQKQAFLAALKTFTSYQFVTTKQSFLSWLSLLERFMSEQIFQPQNVNGSPIQMMGLLEAGGQQFDGLWIMDMSIEAWPRDARPSPFLPINLQREKGVPRSDAGRELAYARNLSQRLSESSNQVIWSFAKQSEGRDILLSPVVDRILEQTGFEDYAVAPYQTLAKQSFDIKSEVEWQDDSQAPALPEGIFAPGGTGFIAAQAVCPLMAFLDFRLSARYGLEKVEEGVESNHVGTIIHKILERFWRTVKTQTALIAEAEQHQPFLAELIDEELAPFASHYPTGFLALEAQRIQTLLLDWLALEKNRPAFEVIGFEEPYTLSIESLGFKIKVDRIDKLSVSDALPNGGLLILDYKTGKASINDLLKIPIVKPQLATYLYAPIETDKTEVVGLGFGLLHHHDGVKFSSLVAHEGVLEAEKNQFDKLSEKEKHIFFQLSWQEGLVLLKEQVAELVDSLKQGEAYLKLDREDDMAYTQSLLALRLPDAKGQLD